jgi:hypothetical protein
MKYLWMNLLSICCIAAAVIMALNKQEYWWLFVLVALFTAHSFSGKE